MKPKQWERTMPAVAPPDNIMSSLARERGVLRGFTPSYELNEERPSMKSILSEEYRKQWFRERLEDSSTSARLLTRFKMDKDTMTRREVTRDRKKKVFEKRTPVQHRRPNLLKRQRRKEDHSKNWKKPEEPDERQIVILHCDLD